MPIYDQGYQRWEGELQRHPVRWWPILRRGVLSVVKQRRYLILLIGSWFWPLVKGVQFFLGSRAGSLLPDLQGSAFFKTGPGFFFDVMNHELVTLSVMIFVVLVGSDIIAQDRRHNALQIYFSKPITPNDYLLGKLGIVGVVLAGAVWVPLLLLWLFAVAVNTQDGYFGQVWLVPLHITVFYLFTVAGAGLLMLTLSSVGRRAVFIAVSWIILFGWGPSAAPSWVMQQLSGNDYWALTRLAGNIEHVGSWIFGVDTDRGFHPLLSLLVLSVVMVACYVILRRRIRPVEVVL